MFAVVDHRIQVIIEECDEQQQMCAGYPEHLLPDELLCLSDSSWCEVFFLPIQYIDRNQEMNNRDDEVTEAGQTDYM